MIGMATGGTIRAETVPCLVSAIEVLKGNGVGVALDLEIGGYVARNRNLLVKTAQEKHMDYIMFIDNDMLFPASGIQRLLDSDKDIVAANYNARGIPDKPVISTLKMVDYRIEENKNKVMPVDIPAQLFKCWALGTGFMLIKMSVFDKLPQPYFVEYEDEEGEHHTEDVEFCTRAHDAGFDVWCLPSIKMKHIGTQQF